MFHHLHTCTGHRNSLYALALGQSPRHVISAGSDGWLTEWDLDQPEIGRVVAQTEGQIFALAEPAQADSPLLLAGQMDGGLYFIDRHTPANTRGIQHHQRGVYGILKFENQLITIGGDGLLTRWDAAAQRPHESIQLSSLALRCVAHSPQNNLLAVGSSDGSIYLLDAHDLTLRHTLEGAHVPSVFTVSWSPDGQRLFSGGRDATLRVWDVAANFCLQQEIAAHWFTVNHLTWSPDGQYFATASRDKTIKIWDGATCALLKVLETQRDHGHINSVNRLLWLPGTLVSCSDDRTVVIWGQENF